MLARDLACAVLGWSLAATVWIAASRLQRSLLSDQLGAEGVPRGLAVVLAVVSTLIAIRALWASRNRGRTLLPPGRNALAEHAKCVGIVAIGFAYVLLAPWSGYVLAAFLLIAATTLYYGARPTAMLAGVALAGAVFLWWMFAKLLSVSMPTGVWSKLLG